VNARTPTGTLGFMDNTENVRRVLRNHEVLIRRGKPKKNMKRPTGWTLPSETDGAENTTLFGLSSVVCGDTGHEERVSTQRVRYIHLNPLRARLVQDLDELASYPYGGHSALMGKCPNDWQDAPKR
jgi:hypothetical protein